MLQGESPDLLLPSNLPTFFTSGIYKYSSKYEILSSSPWLQQYQVPLTLQFPLHQLFSSTLPLNVCVSPDSLHIILLVFLDAHASPQEPHVFLVSNNWLYTEDFQIWGPSSGF